MRPRPLRKFLIFMVATPLAAADHESVILLHGLGRTSRSMVTMAAALTQAGYQVHNLTYPSRTASIETLSEKYVGATIADCQRTGAIVEIPNYAPLHQTATTIQEKTHRTEQERVNNSPAKTSRAHNLFPCPCRRL